MTELRILVCDDDPDLLDIMILRLDIRWLLAHLRTTCH